MDQARQSDNLIKGLGLGILKVFDMIIIIYKCKSNCDQVFKPINIAITKIKLQEEDDDHRIKRRVYQV